MRADVCKRVRVGVEAVRAWPIWEVPRWLVAFIVAVGAVYFAAVALGAQDAAQVSPRDLFTFGALMLCIASTVELTRRAGEDAGVSKDVFAVWELPIAILLPPFYALVAPFLRLALTQWRVRQIRLYRRVFTATAVGVSYGVASMAFHALPSAVTQGPLDSRTSPGHLAAGRGRGGRPAVGGQPAAGAARGQGRRSHHAHPGHAVRA